MSSTYTDKYNPFSLCTNKHSQLETFSRLDLPYWTMISAICVVVNESKCLDIPIWEFSIILEHLPFSLGYQQILRLLLVHRNQAIWIWYPWFWRLSFEMLMNLVPWILRKTLSRLLQNRHGIQLDLWFVGALPPIQQFSNDRCPSVKQNELLRPSSLLHRSPLSYFWLSSGPTPESFPVHPLFFHCCFCCGNLHGLRHRKNCEPNCNVVVNCHPFLQYGPHDDSVDSSIRSLEDSLASKIHASFDLMSLVLPRVSPCLHFLLVLQEIAGGIGVSNFMRAFLMVSLNSLSSGSMK